MAQEETKFSHQYIDIVAAFVAAFPGVNPPDSSWFTTTHRHRERRPQGGAIVTAPKGFTRVPHAVTDALQRGDITVLMFSVLVLLHVWAEWSTGIAHSVSAERII